MKMTWNRARLSGLTAVAAIVLWAGLTPAQVPAPPPAGEQPSNWPLVIESGGDEVIMYQPQLESLNGDLLTARAAVSVRKPGQQGPMFGVVWMESRVAIDRNARTVQILDANITKAKFPDAQPGDQQALADAVRQRTADHPKTLSLDQLLAMLEVVNREQASDVKLDNTAPKIIFLDHPAVKVQYDGPPRLIKVDGTELLRVVNTPFFVVLDPPSKTYFLKGAAQWFAAPDPLGPFQATSAAPPAVAQLADQSGYKDPDQQTTSAAARQNVEIITATEPSELIWTDGPEEMGTIPGTDMLYVTNTDSDVFLQIGSQDLFVLLSGRWFTSHDRQGPWNFVPNDRLPPDFARIPASGPRGDVLAHVSGTPAAQDAVVDTYVPQTAAINRATAERPEVVYDGDPRFEPIEGTQCSYAVNSAFSVVGFAGRYYCCHNAVWYSCAAPIGPWDLCVSVPAEIYTIPPSCPIYAVRYCRVYGYTPDVVYCGYTPGYVGCYAYDNCVVYGTGYYYHPWFSPVHYYPRPFTFGFAARYETYSGSWGFQVGSAWGGVAFVSFLGDGRDRAVPGGHWFGYGGYRPVYVRNDVRVTNVVNINSSRVFESRNLYERRTDVRRDIEVRPTQGPRAERPEAARLPEASHDARNNVYADPEGNVHRKTLDGWESRQGNKWVPQGRSEPAREAPREPVREQPREAVREPTHEAPRSAAPSGQLDRDFRARVTGRDRYENSPQPSRSEVRDEPGHGGGESGKSGPGREGEKGDRR
jgi:hypothetical protein